MSCVEEQFAKPTFSGELKVMTETISATNNDGESALGNLLTHDEIEAVT